MPDSPHQKTSLSPMLCVRNGGKAVDFYQAAFGADVLFRIDEGGVVAHLSIDGSEFWVADESPEHKNFSPETLGGATVRLILVVSDPDAMFARAVTAGASSRLACRGPTLPLASRPRCRSVRAPLGNRETAFVSQFLHFLSYSQAAHSISEEIHRPAADSIFRVIARSPSSSLT